MDDVAGLRQALQELDRRWGEIAERCDPAAWQNSGDVADRVRLHRQEIDRLRRAVVEKAATLLRDGFAPLAHRIVGALGRQQWPERPPEPPDLTELPVGVRPSKMARDLFGVEDNDTLEAGMRFLLWGAMAHEPAAFRRPMGWAETIEAWAELLTVRLPLGDVDQTTRRPLGDGYRTVGQPMQWALKAFEALVSAGAADADTEQGFAIRRRPDGTIIGSETMLAAHGVAAQGREATAVKRRKRSTQRGDGRAKLIAALTKYHEYADDSCLNDEPVGNNKLARLARVSGSTASAFFEGFGGYAAYRQVCADKGKLVASLKLLNQEYSPRILLGRLPLGEGAPDDD